MEEPIGMLGVDQQPGQGAGGTAPEGATTTPEQPKFATIEDLKAAEERLFDKWNVTYQKMFANQENHIKKEYDQRISQIEARYAALGKEVPQSVRDRIADEVATSFEEEGVASQPAQAGSPASQNPVLSEAHRIARDTCGGLLPSDPEYQQIDTSTQSPFEFLKSVEKAAQAKAQRVRQTQAGPAGSAAPMAVQGQAAGGDLAAEYRRKLNETIQQFGSGSDAVLRLRTEYRRKGLNI